MHYIKDCLHTFLKCMIGQIIVTIALFAVFLAIVMFFAVLGAVFA